MRGFGAIPSPADHRDWRLSRITNIGTRFERDFETAWLPPVYNQGSVDSCVAFSLKTIREIQQYKENGYHDVLSAGFIYGNRSPEHWQGEGMYTSEALYQMKRHGVCINALFNMNDLYLIVKSKLTSRMFTNAVSRKISAYARIYTVQEAMSAIKELGAVLFAVPVFNYFYNHQGNGAIERVEDSEIINYHAVTAYGWHDYSSSGKFYWQLRNSWGHNWGDNGNCLLASDYVRRPEMWAITDAQDVNVEHFMKMRIGDSHIFDTQTGALINVGAKALLINNKAYLPVRAVSKLLNREVSWENLTKEIIIKK